MQNQINFSQVISKRMCSELFCIIRCSHVHLVLGSYQLSLTWKHYKFIVKKIAGDTELYWKAEAQLCHLYHLQMWSFITHYIVFIQTTF